MQPTLSKCGNCGNNNFQRIDGLYALTKVEKAGEGISFMPASGIPVIVYICTTCGEIKLFPAKLYGEI